MKRTATPRLAAAFVLGVALCVAVLGRPVRPAGLAQAASNLDGTDATPAGAISTIAIQPPQEFQVPATPDHPAYTLYSPGGPAGAPAPSVALLVLHGMGANGPGMAATILPYARSQGWLVVAPTIPYGDWRDPSQLAGEVLGLQPRLANLLDAVTAETGVPLPTRVMLFGFSRGAQAALRFSVLYPQRVQAVAALSAGTYTLPAKTIKTAAGSTIAAPLPYGLADIEQRAGRSVDQAGLAHVRFWIGVGAKDNRDGDVPRQWDPFVGKNRVERAQRFASALVQLGYQAQVDVVPDAGHELSPPMLEHVTGFLAGVAADLQAQAAAATTTEPVPPSTDSPAPTPVLHDI
ncbi:MAG: alpha/beta hydrolase [Chloroflexota bacterium]